MPAYDENQIVIYTPLDRYYSYIQEMAYKYDPERLVGRAFRQLNVDKQKGELTMEPLEGGNPLKDQSDLYARLADMPGIDTGVTHLKLPNREATCLFLWGAHQDIGLYLRPDSSYPAPRQSYAAHGFVWGKSFKVQNWIVPGKIVQLEGSSICFYAAFFDPA